MAIATKIVPCLWFDSQAEEAARYYTGIFPESRIVLVSRYPAVGQAIHGRAAGSVLTVDFELAGQRVTALNGGPSFRFSEAVSLQVMCDTQQEIDHYWEALRAGGDEAAQQCGWLKDRYGLSWQVVPGMLPKLLTDPDPKCVERVFAAVMDLKKMDIAVL
jgi:predicted 3-demethylubiquinone-9 3-methyltransferase (glyoxalase superfamily)